MGTCIAPRPQSMTFSKYMRSPPKKEDKDLNKSKFQNVQLTKSIVRESGRIETGSVWKQPIRIDDDLRGSSLTATKVKMRRINSIKNYDEIPTVFKIEDSGDNSRFQRFETFGGNGGSNGGLGRSYGGGLGRSDGLGLGRSDGLERSRTIKKNLDISELLNKSRQIQVIKIPQLPSEQQSHLEPFTIHNPPTPSFDISPTHHHHNYSFQNYVPTNIKDLDIDIHIEPPKTSKGYYNIDDATFKEGNDFRIPNKAKTTVVPDREGYFWGRR